MVIFKVDVNLNACSCPLPWFVPGMSVTDMVGTNPTPTSVWGISFGIILHPYVPGVTYVEAENKSPFIHSFTDMIDEQFSNVLVRIGKVISMMVDGKFLLKFCKLYLDEMNYTPNSTDGF